MPTAAKLLLKQAGVASEEFEEFANEMDSVSDAEIDQHIAALQVEVNEIEFRKKMRKTAREHRETRVFETEDVEMDLKLSSTEKKVIDRVPPKVRRDVIERG